MAQQYFATTLPGLEEILLGELRSLGARKAKVEPGGVQFRATRSQFYRVLVQTRVANRVWLRVGEFRATNPIELFNRASKIDWRQLIVEGVSCDVHASTRGSRITHTARIASTVSDALTEQLGKGTSSVRLHARLLDNRCTLNLDASGELLHVRGWREQAGRAPLRETSAAAMLLAAGWSPDEPLLDPMCGSGTFVIEAARSALGLPPRLERQYAVEHWPSFDRELWTAAQPATDAPPSGPGHFRGNDADAEVVDKARANAERAAVASHTSFSVGAAVEVTPAEPGLAIFNPPWGKRMDANALARKLAAIRQHLPEHRLAFLAPRSFEPRNVLRVQRSLSFKAGGIPVRFWVEPARPSDSPIAD